MREINRLVVHCSATPASMDVGMKEIDVWHRQRGFLATPTSPACGYHLVIRRNGVIEKGRPEERPGAHAEGYNADSLAVCLVGGLKPDGKTPENNFTTEQLAALKKVLADWNMRFKKATIFGHRDLPGVAKDCPCFDVRAWLKTF